MLYFHFDPGVSVRSWSRQFALPEIQKHRHVIGRSETLIRAGAANEVLRFAGVPSEGFQLQVRAPGVAERRMSRSLQLLKNFFQVPAFGSFRIVAPDVIADLFSLLLKLSLIALEIFVEFRSGDRAAGFGLELVGVHHLGRRE